MHSILFCNGIVRVTMSLVSTAHTRLYSCLHSILVTFYSLLCQADATLNFTMVLSIRITE